MTDVIAQVPWFDDGHFALASYWLQSDGSYSVDSFSDGDHEDIGEAEMPSPEAQDAAWREYHAHVAETGQDPLSQFNVSAVTRHRDAWHIELREDAGRVLFVQARLAGAETWCRDRDSIPAYLREYLWLEADVVVGSGSVRELVGDCEDDEDVSSVRLDGLVLHVTATVAHAEPRDPADVSQDLRVAGRIALARSPESL